MTPSAAPWRLDRLPAAAREAAELASTGAGLTLSAWLTRLIHDTAAAEGVTWRDTTVVEFARKTASASAAPVATLTAEEPRLARPAMIPGATMLPVAAIRPVGLGTRHGEEVPEEMVSDLAQRGVRQPLRVRRAAEGDNRYELICGHRRWRAAQRIGLAQVPATIGTDDDGQAVLASLAENLARGDLSIIEEAQAYFRLLTRCAIEIDAITQACGRERQHIIRRLRLLGLSQKLRQAIAAGALSPAHADLLLDATNPEGLADAIIAENLSVEGARQRMGGARKSEPSP
jgi:ParB family transcriptional regulator, chromosome partitioning protein